MLICKPRVKQEKIRGGKQQGKGRDGKGWFGCLRAGQGRERGEEQQRGLGARQARRGRRERAAAMTLLYKLEEEHERARRATSHSLFALRGARSEGTHQMCQAGEGSLLLC